MRLFYTAPTSHIIRYGRLEIPEGFEVFDMRDNLVGLFHNEEEAKLCAEALNSHYVIKAEDECEPALFGPVKGGE